MLIGTLTLAFNVPSADGWTGTVYIRADGSVDPPDAPIITYDKVTYALTDNITSDADGIVIERNNIILDGAGYTVQGSGAYGLIGVSLSGRMNVTVRNTQIKNFSYGILLYSSNNSISGNTMIHNEVGILLMDHNNTLVNNTVSGNVFGIWLSSSHNILRNNTMIDNRYNLIEGIWLFESSPVNDVDTSNTVNGKPIYILTNKSNVLIDPSTFPSIGYLALRNCYNVTIQNLTLSNNGLGMSISESENITVIGNTFKDNMVAFPIKNANGTTFENNTIVENLHGVSVGGGFNNAIVNNTFKNNTLRSLPYRWPEKNAFSSSKLVDKH
jgi:parallel beta-helix repeat protein